MGAEAVHMPMLFARIWSCALFSITTLAAVNFAKEQPKPSTPLSYFANHQTLVHGNGGPERTDETQWLQRDARLIAVGDVHGELAGLLQVLRSAGMVTEEEPPRWAGGNRTLVSMGDLLDRGPHSKQVVELFMRLEGEAQAAQGKVVVLLGNHEAMNLLGDFRYVSAQELHSFGGPQARRKELENGRIGAWLRARPAVVKIEDTIFVHGSLNPVVASLGIDEINRQIAVELEQHQTNGWLTTSEYGPLWDRSLATKDECSCSEQAKRVLSLLGASKIVVGHTVTESGVIERRCGGQVFLIDTGMVFGGRSALVIEPNGVAKELTPQGWNILTTEKEVVHT